MAQPKPYLGAQNDLLFVIDAPPNWYGESAIPNEDGPNVIAGPFNLDHARTQKELEKLCAWMRDRIEGAQ